MEGLKENRRNGEVYDEVSRVDRLSLWLLDAFD